MLREFREFAMRGNVVDMAVGIILGGAFGLIARSLVDDVLMPPIGLLLGSVDFSNLFVVLQEGSVPAPYASLAAAREGGAVAIAYGAFLNTVINFLIVALAVFLVIRALNRLKREEEKAPPTTRDCPYCRSSIHIEASRCAHCTAELAAA